MTTNDRLQEAIEKYGTPLSDNRVVVNLDDVPRIAYRAGLDAVQPAPTDAEIERAIDRLELATIEWARSNEPSRTTVSTGPRGDKTVELHDALLRLIAARRAAARRDALEDALRAIDADIPDDPNTGVAFMLAEAGAKRARFIVSSMLAEEDGDE